MAANAGSSVLRQLRFVVASWREDGRTDVELLHRFIQSRDEQAFTTLVGRHGELVWSVCLRVLRNRADAEDALQATFLRLARDAGRIANREAVAGWLFRVARDCAIDLRRSILRQRRIEERLAAASGRAENEQPPTDLRLLLDDALARLSSTERSVLVLVCLEGRTYSDAALEMGCSVAAVHRRFLRAQTRLRRLFARRGAASTGILAGGVGVAFALEASAVPPRVLAATVEKSLAASGGSLPNGQVSAIVNCSTAGIKYLGSVSVVGIVIAIAVSLYAARSSRTGAHTPSPTAERVADSPVAAPRPEEPGTTVFGVIRGADGEPFPGVEVVALARQPFGPGERGLRDTVLAKATTDDGGRFTLRVPDDFATWFADRVVTLHVAVPGLAPATLPVRIPESSRSRTAGSHAAPRFTADYWIQMTGRQAAPAWRWCESATP